MAKKPGPVGFGGNRPRQSAAGKRVTGNAEKVVQKVGKQVSTSRGGTVIKALADSKLTTNQKIAAVQRFITPFGGRIDSKQKEALKNQFMMYRGTIKPKSSRPIASAVERAKASSKKK